MKEAKKIRQVFKGNILIDGTRGVVHIGEIIEMVMDGFEQVMKEGPLAREPGIQMKVTLMDCKLHEDAIHRGPAQLYPAVRDGIREAMMHASPMLFEPLQVLRIEAPVEYMGEMSKLVGSKRGQLIEMNQEGTLTVITAKMPVNELLGWSARVGFYEGLDRTIEWYCNNHDVQEIRDELQQRLMQR